MLLIDTDAVTPPERAEAFRASLDENCTSSSATFEDPSTLQAEVHVYDLGPARVLTMEAGGTTLRRSPRLARAVSDESAVALAMPLRNDNHLSWDREHRLVGPRDMVLIDLSSPYVYGWSGDGASYSFHVDQRRLDLPMDTVRTASRQLHSSPIYPLVRDHIARVTTGAAQIAGSTAAAQVGEASLELMRALVVSAAGDTARLREAEQRSSAARVQAYVRHHLRDPDLGPVQVAAANGLSVRALYTLYESLGSSLEQSIIQQRLEGARTELSADVQRHTSIAALGRAWGFSNPSFFASRFRGAFGVSPRQWRAGLRPLPTTSGPAVLVPPPRQGGLPPPGQGARVTP